MNTTDRFQPKHMAIVCVLSLTFALTGCATGQTPEDPYENYNRKVFAFNRQVDKFLYRPIAKTYDYVTPKPIRRGVTNVLNNFGQLPIIGNDLLQANGEWLVSDIGRLIINTTLGIGGLFDVATKAGIEKHQQDFGLTLAKWGFRKSSYLILPLLPSTTPRDLIGFGGDLFMTPWPYINTEWPWGWTVYGARFVDNRAALLGPDKLIDEAFDPYVFVRDAYLQRRQAQIEEVLHPHGDGSEFDDDAETSPPTAAESLEVQAAGTEKDKTTQPAAVTEESKNSAQKPAEALTDQTTAAETEKDKTAQPAAAEASNNSAQKPAEVPTAQAAEAEKDKTAQSAVTEKSDNPAQKPTEVPTAQAAEAEKDKTTQSAVTEKSDNPAQKPTEVPTAQAVETEKKKTANDYQA